MINLFICLRQHRATRWLWPLLFLLLCHHSLNVYAQDEIDDAPEPPRDLQIEVLSGKIAQLSWQPPENHRLSGYRLTVVPLSESDESGVRQLNISAGQELPVTIRDLVPGGQYEVQLQTLHKQRHSSVFLAANFTTKPNVPGRFIVWFRNESSLLVLLQPPYPSGIFDLYQVQIQPEDAFQSQLEVRKDQEPPVPAQAAFHGLVPGRAYHISVRTKSGNQLSAPSEAQYRTVPLPPTQLSVRASTLTSSSFELTWAPPSALSEFDRYQFTFSVRSTPPQTVSRNAPAIVRFDEDLQPGRTYEVVAKTVSGNVLSWPVTTNVTTRPLPVVNLVSRLDAQNGILLKWLPSNESTQDAYQIRYHELEAFNTDGAVRVVHETKAQLIELLHGRNYSIAVQALSGGSASEETLTFQATRPAPPVIESVQHTWQDERNRLNISWKSDVTSRQEEFEVIAYRSDSSMSSLRSVSTNKTLPMSKNSTETDSIIDLDGQPLKRITRQHWLLLDGLTAGAVYTVNVTALSYGLRSEPHSVVQSVPPRPPLDFRLVATANSSAELAWHRPPGLLDGFVLRYRTGSAAGWTERWLPAEQINVRLNDLLPGERYIFRLQTISSKFESVELAELQQSLQPNAVDSVSHVVASNNVTFKLLPPIGRVDYYLVLYNIVSDDAQPSSKQILPSGKAHLGDIVTIVIDSLTSGELYDFKFYAVSESLRSQPLSVRLRTQPLISSVINIVIDEQDTRTLGIKYTPTPRRAISFDRYRFQLTSDASIPAQEKLANDTHRLVLFDHLVPGRLYNLSIWTVSGGVYSVPIQRQVRLYPEPVRQLQAQRVTDSELTLSWQPPFGEQDGFEVTYLDPTRPHQLISNVTSAEKISYKQLRPHTNYTFEVCTLAGRASGQHLLRSSPVTRTLQTLESTPGQVSQFRPVRVRPNEITFSWKLPQSAANGVLTGYKITYELRPDPQPSTDVIASTGPTAHYQLFEPSVTEGTIGNLQSGRRYLFSIQAHTKVGAGPKAEWEQRMPIWPPPKPAANSLVQLISRTPNTLQVRFMRNFFSSLHGVVRWYSLIVVEEPPNGEQPSLGPSVVLPSWQEVYQKDVWPAYQTSAPFQPFESGQLVADYIIGSQNCGPNVKNAANTADELTESSLTATGESSAAGNRYCNGPLRPSTSYRVKLRAYTDLDKFSDTDFSYVMQTEPDHGSLWMSLLTPLLLIALAGGLLFAWRARHQWTGALAGRSLDALTGSSHKPPLTGNTLTVAEAHHAARNQLLFGSKLKKPKLPNVHMQTMMHPHMLNGSNVGQGPPGVIPGGPLGPHLSSKLDPNDINATELRPVPSCRPVKLNEFATHFRIMSADSDFRFSEEFELLKMVGRERPCSAADLPVNRPKNRFTNILPYDHSRVKLSPTDDEDGSDYINANYVPGFNSPREFLVTQGPLPGTRDDFWRMIWEQNSRAIVMLTRCVEKGREKCDHYWPFTAQQPVLYGDIAVTMLSETQHPHWTISELKVSRLEQIRMIRHFHFTSWPDFGVPEPPSMLIRFVRSFRERVPPEGGSRPITVHCSAGVGRSGTFIALDRLLQHIKVNDYVDIYGIVHEMRKERVWMVQNEQQYICIHQCLLEVLEGKEDLYLEPTLLDNPGFEDDEGIAESGM